MSRKRKLSAKEKQMEKRVQDSFDIGKLAHKVQIHRKAGLGQVKSLNKARKVLRNVKSSRGR